jgi:hypothetical protein
MAVHQRHVEITSPCPVKLDPDRGKRGEKGWYCGHCRKNVHVLSNLTEREARALLADNVGKDLCVTYAVRADGTIRFRPEPDVVPIGALRRKRAAAAAAVGLSAALAACAPHENPAVELPQMTIEDSPSSNLRATPSIPDAPPAPESAPPVPTEPELRLVDGGIRPRKLPPKPGGLRVRPLPEPEPAPLVDGGFTVAPLPDGSDEPCDPRARDGAERPRGPRAG